jgi:glutaredoxin
MSRNFKTSILILFSAFCTFSLGFSISTKPSRNYREMLIFSSKFQISGPTPRKFYVEPSKLVDLAASGIQFALRLGSGAFVKGYQISIEDDEPTKYSIVRAFDKRIYENGQPLKLKPSQPIELYEFEGCPFCRKVREAVSILDIDVVFYPTPKGGPTFRVKAQKLGGKQQFPFMVDPNSKVQMYESDDIIKYLFDTYSVIWYTGLLHLFLI